MTLEAIQTFLKVVETNNIVSASEQLYISQSTASQRIKALEDELGYQLFYRQKGIRSITLTNQGKSFLPIARAGYNLYRDALNIKDHPQKEVFRIGAINSINHSILLDFYDSYSVNHSEIYLNIQTHHSHEINQLVSESKLDLGLVSNIYPYANITSRLLLEEEVVMLVPEDFEIDQYEEYEEIYLSYSKEYDQYHYNLFPKANRIITVGTSDMAIGLLRNRRYGLVIQKVAEKFIHNHSGYKMIRLSSPYVRKIYAITSGYTREPLKKIADDLVEELIAYEAV